MPLVVLCGPGQAGDAPMFPVLLSHLRVATSGPGRPRTRPDKVRGDKAYSSKAIRELLRSRGIQAVIPQPADQIGHRKRRGSAGGRPPAFDAEDYKGRNVVERSFQRTKQWRGIATRYDKHNLNYRGGAVLTAIFLWLKRLWDRPYSPLLVGNRAVGTGQFLRVDEVVRPTLRIVLPETVHRCHRAGLPMLIDEPANGLIG